MNAARSPKGATSSRKRKLPLSRTSCAARQNALSAACERAPPDAPHPRVGELLDSEAGLASTVTGLDPPDRVIHVATAVEVVLGAR